METTTQSYFWPVLVACFGGVFVLAGVYMEVVADKEWFNNIKSKRRWDAIKHWGGWLVVIGVLVEVVVAAVAAIGERQTKDDINRIDPVNLPILNINAFVKLRVKGKDFPDLTQWGTSSLLTNWGSKTATAMLCGNDPTRALSSSIPSLFTDDFGTGDGYSDFREYFLNFRMESVSAAMNLQMQPAAKSVTAANLFRMDANFLPPQSEILDGYAFVVINNSLWKFFRIYPQKDTQPPLENQANVLASAVGTNLGNVKWRIRQEGDSNTIAHTTIRTSKPGKMTVISNSEVQLAFPLGHIESRVMIVGTNVPDGKFDLNLWK